MFRFWIFLILAAQVFGAASSAVAGQLRELYRSPRAEAMGGAYTAVADDEAALYLNPAGLAGARGATFHLLPLDLMGTGDIVLSATETAKAVSSIDGDALNALMGKNIHAQATVTPTLIMPGFGVGCLVDADLGAYNTNKALPQMNFIYQTTSGIQMGMGFVVGGKSKGKDSSELRVGFAAKYMYRRGGPRKIPVSTLLSFNTEKIKGTIGNWGSGMGGDLGGQYLLKVAKHMWLQAGAAYLDVGDTNFGEGPTPQKGSLNFGTAARLDIGAFKTILAYDYKHYLDKTDWRKKGHLGLEIGTPMFSIYGGINQVYFTYGMSINLWMVKLTAASYADENGSFAFQNPERRYVLRVDVKLGI